jgi:hypothetical protein
MSEDGTVKEAEDYDAACDTEFGPQINQQAWSEDDSSEAVKPYREEPTTESVAHPFLEPPMPPSEPISHRWPLTWQYATALLGGGITLAIIIWAVSSVGFGGDVPPMPTTLPPPPPPPPPRFPQSRGQRHSTRRSRPSTPSPARPRLTYRTRSLMTITC